MKKILFILTVIICFLSFNKITVNAEETTEDTVVNVQIVHFDNTGSTVIENISVECPSGTYEEVFLAVDQTLSLYFKDYSYYIVNQYGTTIEQYWGSTENTDCYVKLTDYTLLESENNTDTQEILIKIYRSINNFFIVYIFFQFMPYVTSLAKRFSGKEFN